MEATPGADCRWHPIYSRCHSYASLCGALLQKHLLGATVEGKTVRLSPCFAGLEQAPGVVPTASGDVRISWTRRPDGVLLKVAAPRAVHIRLEPQDADTKVRPDLRRLATMEGHTKSD
jgi:hypothetical protein